jgi:type II secretory pathway component PulK
MGPKLTENEINEIQQIIHNYNRMNSKTKKKIININLIRMNELYTTAISKESSEKDARNAVDELKKMRPQFRSYFQNIVDMMLNQKESIKHFIEKCEKNIKKYNKKTLHNKKRQIHNKTRRLPFIFKIIN